MVGPVRIHGTDHAAIVDAGADFRKDIADLNAALAVLLEAEGRFQQVAGLALGLQIAGGHGLAVVLIEHRLGVEGIHLRGAAVQKKEDDAFRFGREVGRFGGERIGFDGGPNGRRARQPGKRGHPETGSESVEAVPSGHHVG